MVRLAIRQDSDKGSVYKDLFTRCFSWYRWSST